MIIILKLEDFIGLNHLFQLEKSHSLSKWSEWSDQEEEEAVR